MSQCSSYQLKIPDNSNTMVLYEELTTQYGVKDSDLDCGYHVVNYNQPGTAPTLVGAGDCIVEEKEVLEFTLDAWKKFRAPLERYAGRSIPWALEKEGSIFPSAPDRIEKNRKYLKKIDDFIVLVRKALDKSGYKADVPRYKEGMAVAIFHFFVTPLADYLKIWPPGQIAEKRSELNAVLSPFGLEEIADYILENGGNGAYQVSAKANPYDPHATKFAVSPYNLNYDVYSIFKRAGLEAQMVEAYPLMEDDICRCGTGIQPRIVVGLQVGEGYRLFDSVYADDNLKRKNFYPIHLRHILGYYDAMKGVTNILKESVEKGELSVPAESATREDNELSVGSFYSWIYSGVEYFFDDEEGFPTEWVERGANLWEQGSSNPYFTLLIGSIIHDERPHIIETLLDNPLPSIKGEAYLLIMSKKAKEEGKSLEVAADYAEKLLAIDDRCNAAHEVLAKYYYVKEEYESAEVHFKKAESLAVDEKHLKDIFYLRWGRMCMDRGRMKEAVKKFQLALERFGPGNVNFFYLQLLIGAAFEKMGRKDDAESYFELVYSSLRSFMSHGDEDTNLENADKAMKKIDEVVREYMPGSKSVGKLYLRLVHIYLYSEKLDRAEEALKKAAGYDSESFLYRTFKDEISNRKKFKGNGQ